MRCLLRIAPPAVSLAVLSAPTAASAVEFKDLAGRPLVVDVTNTAVTEYHFDNRNDYFDGVRKPGPKTKVDDNYFDYVDRFNVQVGYWRFRLNVRLDGQAYAGTIGPGNVSDHVLAETKHYGEVPNRDTLVARSNEYLAEVSTRFRPGIYPAKLSLTYQQPGVDVTAGDFYAQLGRGLVLSVRKIDELAIDTTIRGAKVQISKALGGFRIGGTLLGGLTNPQRVDETTGRIVTMIASPVFFGFPEPNPLQYYDPATGKLATSPASRPSYLPDAIFGGRLEGGHRLVQLAANASVLLREDHSLDYQRCVQAATDAAARNACLFSEPVLDANNPSIVHAQIRTWSGSVLLPQLGKYADLYVEVAGQQLTGGTVTSIDEQGKIAERQPDIGGYAVYANANARFGSLTLSLEAKHYRRFFALAANVNTDFKGYAAPEFQILGYSQPPTAEPIYVQPLGSPNVCNTGARADARFRFNRRASVFGWLGYYASFSEYGQNPTCEEKPELRTNTWDSAIGADLSFEGEQSYAKVWLGSRFTDLEVPTDGFVNVAGTTAVFYREGYARYDLVKHLWGPVSLQSQGFHRRRYIPERFGSPWWEGENYLALQWAPRVSAVLGYEYTNQLGCSRDAKDGDFCHYVSGGLQWHGAASDGIWGQIFNLITLFVGQRRAAIRCVSGVCRQFPAFEGAKLELVSRF